MEDLARAYTLRARPVAGLAAWYARAGRAAAEQADQTACASQVWHRPNSRAASAEPVRAAHAGAASADVDCSARSAALAWDTRSLRAWVYEYDMRPLPPTCFQRSTNLPPGRS